MRVLIAPDSFKGSMTAAEAAESIYLGAKAACSEARLKKLPLSDGGEGLVDCLVSATGGKIKKIKVTGPMGKAVIASWGVLDRGQTAVIEMASASGLLIVSEGERDPRIATTFGTGELIKAAIDEGCKKIILGLGGSATNDGGSGMAQALGVNLLDKHDNPIPFGGQGLSKLERIDNSNIDPRLKAVEILVACDVNNVLTGEGGASHVFGPQKGASPEMVAELDHAMVHYANIIKRDLKLDVEYLPGAGAAGGVGAAVVAFLGGTLTSGIDLVAETIGMEDEIKNCDLVITGEGKFDLQSKNGKVPIGVAKLAEKFNVPVVVLAGYISDDLPHICNDGITAYFSIINKPMKLETAMLEGEKLLELKAFQLMRLFTCLYKMKSNYSLGGLSNEC